MPVKSVCGTILISTSPDVLARFYAQALELQLEREDHAGLAPHWGVDIGTVHFGIHPPVNFKNGVPGRGGIVLAFSVASLSECQARLSRLGSPCLAQPHDEGFGMVALYRDPDGNPFEVVELTYDFGRQAQ